MATENALEAPIAPEDKKKADKIRKYLMAGQNYKAGRDLYNLWAEYQRFWESDQWPQSQDEETSKFPKPVTNHFSEIIDMKVAGLTYEKPGIYFEPQKGSIKDNFDVPVVPIDPEDVEEEEELSISAAEMLAKMVEDVNEYNDIENVLEEFCRSSALLGNSILYCYWDNSIEGMGEGAYIGEIGVMEVDIADFYVGDPKEPNIQKQPYVIVTERRPRDQVIEDYEAHSDMAKFIKQEAPTSRTRIYDHEKVEQDKADYVDVVHYFEKKKVEDTAEFGDTKLKRHTLMVNYTVVCQDYVLREEEDYAPNKMYPFVNFAWMPRRKSFYGKAESTDLISNQKELNRLQGIALLGAYKTGLPNVRYKKDFVKKEDIPIGPGGNVIEDRTPVGQGWGIEYLQPPTIASYIPLLRDSLSQGMRDTSGVHEAWSGKAPSAHLNASAIMALQEAAGVRIRGIQRRFYSAVRDLGKLYLGYIMQYYTENRLYKVYAKKNIEGKAWFTIDRFKDLHFDVKVTKGSASPYAKTVIASTLESMLEQGVIDGDLYLKMLPPEVFPKVTELLELKEDRAVEQQQMMVEQQKAIVDEIVSQVVEQAREQGTEITPEALQEMKEMVKEQAEEEEV